MRKVFPRWTCRILPIKSLCKGRSSFKGESTTELSTQVESQYHLVRPIGEVAFKPPSGEGGHQCTIIVVFLHNPFFCLTFLCKGTPRAPMAFHQSSVI